jgi:aminotransferase
MAIGEANFDPPDALVEIACRLLHDKENRKSLYTSTRGLPEARQAVSRFIRRQFGADVDPEENILMTVGGTEALHLAIKVLVERGDRVLLPNPGWGPCAALVKRQGANIELYELARDETWTVDADAIVAKLDPSVKVLVVNSPSNPTGAMLSAAGWRTVMEAARANDVVVISDEVYHNYSYTGEYASALALDAEFANLVVIGSFSKTFAIMGWRIGFVLAHPWLIRQMDVYKETVSACTPSIAQWAIAEYLDDSDDYLRWAFDLCKDNMEKSVALLNTIPGVDCPAPQGGFYLFPDFSAHEASSAKLAERLLRGGLATAMGASFGSRGEGCARLLFSAHWAEVGEGIARIERALTSPPQA